jgi:hypothetical protein
MEVYHPPHLFQGNAPRITTPPPTFTPYGSSFEVGYAFDSPAEVTAVVLHNAGGVTHNYAIGELFLNSQLHCGLARLQGSPVLVRLSLLSGSSSRLLVASSTGRALDAPCCIQGFYNYRMQANHGTLLLLLLLLLQAIARSCLSSPAQRSTLHTAHLQWKPQHHQSMHHQRITTYSFYAVMSTLNQLGFKCVNLLDKSLWITLRMPSSSPQ